MPPARTRKVVHRAGRARASAWAVVGVLFLAVGSDAASLVVRNARLIDGIGAPPRDGMSIVIRDGRITEVGTDVDARDIPALDVAGATVIPGLVDPTCI
jgi:imidazolonepropionase-like amidohydrolase